MITDPKGIVRVPDIWTDENWREGLDNSYNLLTKFEEARVPIEAYGDCTIADTKIAHSKQVRTVALIDRVKGLRWLIDRTANSTATIDYRDPLVTVWAAEAKVPDAGDLKDGTLVTEGFWGFAWGFPEEDTRQGVRRKRFSETLMAIKDYSFYGLPSFMAYCWQEGRAGVRELTQLNPSSQDVRDLLATLK